MLSLSVTEVRRKLNEALNDVQFKGVSLVISRNGRPAAKLVPIGDDVNVADVTASLVPPPGSELAPPLPPPETPGKTPVKTPGKGQTARKTR